MRVLEPLGFLYKVVDKGRVVHLFLVLLEQLLEALGLLLCSTLLAVQLRSSLLCAHLLRVEVAGALAERVKLRLGALQLLGEVSGLFAQLLELLLLLFARFALRGPLRLTFLELRLQLVDAVLLFRQLSLEVGDRRFCLAGRLLRHRGALRGVGELRLKRAGALGEVCARELLRVDLERGNHLTLLFELVPELLAGGLLVLEQSQGALHLLLELLVLGAKGLAEAHELSRVFLQHGDLPLKLRDAHFAV
mmetsp:Transcript_12579/g.35533  ORF Transcript_12579/g.35533 Transcript_12579/m.35533 type:complete len:249 (-) Transcript_12579:341-1087(-)